MRDDPESAEASVDRSAAPLVAPACIEFVYGGLAENPHRVGHPLRFDLGGKHSARRGDFRIVYEIGESHRVVTILAIDHRSDIYRPR